MRKVMPYLGASLSLLAAMWATSAKAQDQSSFKDVDSSHWAYQAVTDLQQKGIIIGYPDGYFRGKRTLTRYEFAIALYRALQKIGPGQQGPPGPPGEKGDKGDPGMTPEEVKELAALTQEFKNDLAQLGANVKEIQSRLDAMAKDIADIKDYLNKQPKISGDLFTGFRSNRSRFGFQDYSGAFQPASSSLTGNVQSVHDVHIDVSAKLPYDVKALVDVVFGNYLSYRSNATGSTLGGAPAANYNGGPEQVTAYQAAVQIPIKMINPNTALTVGRFEHQVTPLTYWRPDTDSYFDLPWYDNGKYVQDGFKFESKFGSATTSLFAGSYTSLTTSSGGSLLNAPLVGANYGPRALSVAKPSGVSFFDQGQILPSQSMGVHVGIPLFKIGEIGFTAEDFGGGTEVGPVVGPFYNNVVVYGANVTLKNLGRFSVSGEFAKSVEQVGIGATASINRSNDDNNAFILHGAYKSGAWGAELGYQWIDPRFGAPGYWNKIGNWTNPTNINGGYLRGKYTGTRNLELSLGADYYGGASNRVSNSLDGLGVTGFTKGSNILRGLAGAKYTIGKYFDLSADYEYVGYDFSGSVNPLQNGRANYLEQYITLGVGLHLTGNSTLKVSYQMINNQNVDGSFTGVLGYTSNASVLTTQLAVHF